MTSSPSPSTENQCYDVVADAARLSKDKDVSSGHVEDENEEDEEGDMDFNPFLKEAPSLEASSSLSSEIEELDANVVDSREKHSPMVNLTDAPSGLRDEPNVGTDRVTDATVNECQDVAPSEKLDAVSDDEDAIWRRTRARYSLVGSTLDELETFLQETDDEDDLHHNVDDEEEYRKFLAAVLLDGDSGSGAAQENENFDEDEDNDADFELELEEALGSDDDNLPSVSHEWEHEHVGRRPETRQKKRQKTDPRDKKFSGQTNRPLRPILPSAPIAPSSSQNARCHMIQSNSFAKNDYISVFTPYQIGQLHCLMYEHVQLLVQVFSLSVLEPSRQHVATQVHKLLSEMLHKRDQALASRRVPYPNYCFHLPYIRSDVAAQNTSEPESLSWVPFVSNTVLSVMDVAPLNLVQSYMDDISVAAQEHQQRQLEVSYDGTVNKECLFPFKSSHSSTESAGVSSDPTPSKVSDQKSKRTTAAALVERCKKQSIALVPKEVAKLALRFFPVFNPALFPHKPPSLSIANRMLFTDSEDRLLALGLMKYNTDWKEIQKHFLPCKTPHQIFVRQKNRACSRAPENPIKAVRRIKTSPLTQQEIALIEEGLKIYKLDWTAVWKYMVPHRDPSLLARQWRTAVGNQKSYKGDEHTRAKRRLYESQRRRLKIEGSRLQTPDAGQNIQGWSTEDDGNLLPGCRTLSDKENCSTDNAGGENNSGDDVGNNEDEEAYVHEAFLADWRPGPSGIVSNTGEHQHVDLFTQPIFTNDTRVVNFHPQHLNAPYHRVPTTILRPSEPEISLRPYRARRSSCSRLVKLAPDLPPVNLPPTVRIMSQSAFSKYQDEASSKAKQKVVFSHPRTSQLDEQNSVRSITTSDAVEKGDSDLQMHPLLFQDHEDESLPYYPLSACGASSSSFNFFPNSPPQLNLNLFRSQQAKHTLNFFRNPLRSKELSASSTAVDFHPLLQRTADGNGTPYIPEPPADSSAISGVPRSPSELDLDIRLSSSLPGKENGTSARESGPTEMQPTHGLVEENGNDPCLEDTRNDEIVMEQEELSDSEDEEMAESVEFECEEMTDSEGEGGSDSDRLENVQNEDVQDDTLPTVLVNGDESDQDEPRCQETRTSDKPDARNEPKSLLGSSLNPKPPVTRAHRCSKKTTLSQHQVDAVSQIKKPRKRAQKPDHK